jgi:triacylglycerol lipase
MVTTNDERPRTPLSQRLDSLFAATIAHSRPRSSPDPADATHRPMRLASPPRRSSSIPRAFVPQTPSHAHFPSLKMPPEPVLRWLVSRPQAGPSAPSPAPSPSQSLSLLREALTETLPTPPPQAHLPSAFHVSHTLTRPPPFLDNLTRSTLPTASLSPFSTPDRVPSPLSEQSPTHVSPVATSLSSLETLRALIERGIHTSAVASAAPTPSRSWWFQPENKDNVDTLLHEDDRADSVQQEQDKIRRKCLLTL